MPHISAFACEYWPTRRVPSYFMSLFYCFFNYFSGTFCLGTDDQSLSRVPMRWVLSLFCWFFSPTEASCSNRKNRCVWTCPWLSGAEVFPPICSEISSAPLLSGPATDGSGRGRSRTTQYSGDNLSLCCHCQQRDRLLDHTRLAYGHYSIFKSTNLFSMLNTFECLLIIQIRTGEEDRIQWGRSLTPLFVCFCFSSNQPC